MMSVDSERQLRECCEQIRSVLATQNEGLSLRQFMQDYRQLTFRAEIPFRTFGYGSLEEFLGAIPDVCTVVCHGGIIDRLYAVTSENTAKVQDMNMRHKKKGANHSAYQATAMSASFRQAAAIYDPLNHYNSYNRISPLTSVHPAYLNGGAGSTRTGGSNFSEAVHSYGGEVAPSLTRGRRPELFEKYVEVENAASRRPTEKAIGKPNGVSRAVVGRESTKSSNWIALDEHMKSVPLRREDIKGREAELSGVRKSSATRKVEAVVTPFAVDSRSLAGKVPPGLEAMKKVWSGEESVEESSSLAVPVHGADLQARFGDCCMHLVVVCHVVSYSEFYVQLVDERHVLETMSNQLNEGGTLRSSQCSFGELLASLNENRRKMALGAGKRPETNGVNSSTGEEACYALLSSDAMRFSRVRLVNERDGLFEVYQQDTGKRCNVSPSRIFAIDGRYSLLRRAGLAYRCRLPVVSTRRLLGDEDVDDGEDDPLRPRPSRSTEVGFFEWLVTRTVELHMKVLSIDDSQPQSLVVDLFAHQKSPVSVVRVLHEFGALEADLNSWTAPVALESASQSALKEKSQQSAPNGTPLRAKSHETMAGNTNKSCAVQLADDPSVQVSRSQHFLKQEASPTEALPLGGIDAKPNELVQHVAVHVMHAYSPSYFACVPYDAVDSLRELILLMQIAFSVTDPSSGDVQFAHSSESASRVDACGQRVCVNSMLADHLYAAYVQMDERTDELFNEPSQCLWLRVTVVDDCANNDGLRCCFCVDYGKMVLLGQQSSVYILPEEFVAGRWETSAFALSDIRPVGASTETNDSHNQTSVRCGVNVTPALRAAWSDTARNAFARYTVGKDLFALLPPKDPDSFGSVKMVRLVDTTGDDDVLVSDVLVANGFAESCLN